MNYEDYLFEISSEVCQKFGGIYTVLSSKAKHASYNFGNYFCVGLYNDNSKKEFVETKVPLEFEGKISMIEDLGIKVHFGYWDIEGQPKTLLVEHIGYAQHNDYIKGKLWEWHGIDSLNSYWFDFDEMILWSWACGVVIEKLTEDIENDIFVHSHEWISGGAIFYLKDVVDEKKYKTVFTTHATMLGRTICGVGENVYAQLGKIDADDKSYELGVHTKQQTERALAKTADCFTTVSDITAQEAKHFYGKAPDVLLYNGIDNYDFSNMARGSVFHAHSRNILNNFLKRYFKNYYDVDLKESLIYYTGGRNEFRNKGVDMYIKSLGLLNEKLKRGKNKGSKTIINLFMIPVGEFEVDKRLFEESDEIFGDNAPLSTHHIGDESEIIRAFKEEGLLNSKEDKVKVILMPFYLNGDDGLIDMKYYETISGCDLGIFASFYEPWGYTPLESIAYGVPTVTSNLAGFGRAIEKDFKRENKSVLILDREKSDFDKSVLKLYKFMLKYSKFSDKGIKGLKSDSFKFAKNFSWDRFYDNYLKAYEIARKGFDFK